MPSWSQDRSGRLGEGVVPGKAEATQLQVLGQEITNCFRCSRLVAHRELIGIEKRRSYRDQQYWSRPVPGFGDADARLLIVGLAPGAHGANRTGRMFTGDRSGEFLYRALWETGFANQPTSVARHDGLLLKDAYIAAAVRCVPPDNKPLPLELLACRPFLDRELRLLRRVRLVVALGAIGLGAYLDVLQQRGRAGSKARYPFSHGALFDMEDGGPRLLSSYHPSQQNTATGRLTADMLREIFARARALISET